MTVSGSIPASPSSYLPSSEISIDSTESSDAFSPAAAPPPRLPPKVSSLKNLLENTTKDTESEITAEATVAIPSPTTSKKALSAQNSLESLQPDPPTINIESEPAGESNSHDHSNGVARTRSQPQGSAVASGSTSLQRHHSVGKSNSTSTSTNGYRINAATQNQHQQQTGFRSWGGSTQPKVPTTSTGFVGITPTVSSGGSMMGRSNSIAGSRPATLGSAGAGIRVSGPRHPPPSQTTQPSQLRKTGSLEGPNATSASSSGLVVPRNHTNVRRSIIETVVTPSSLGDQSLFGSKRSFKKATDPEPTKIYDSRSSSSSSESEAEGDDKSTSKKAKSYLNHSNLDDEDEEEREEEYRRLTESGAGAVQRRRSMPMPVEE